MHPFTFIIALSATALALPQPLPAAIDDASSAILGGLKSGLNGVLGSPEQRHESGEEGHASGCHYRHKEDIATCINACVAQCPVDPEDCHTCIRGCSSQYGCESHHHGGKKHHHDKPSHRDDEPNSEDESLE